MRLGDYLGAPRPAWDWVTLDCCRWVDGWVRAHGHDSPIAALGLTYSTEIGARLTMARAGGLVPLWTAGMALVGVPEVDEARAGDVGVIERITACGSNEVAAIFTGERWASLTERGLELAPADPLRAWRP